MDDKNKLIEKLGELSAKAYMFGRMYHIDEVAELTKDINELIAKVFDYSPWYTGTPTEEGLYAVYFLDDHNPSATPYEVLYDGFLSPDGEGNWIDRDGEIRFIDDDIVRWHKIEKED